ncbi:MAG TPA: ThiF family adenylyltransferase [Planktothrix sp.]|jgi:molybdopterin/thiamine biosynthesis adenylyltransferase
MTHRLHHETIYRGREFMQKLACAHIHICGAGALGSNLAVNLARIGVAHLTIIDMDRIEQTNIGTQVYSMDDVGARKADMLRNLIYRDVGADVEAHAGELTDKNVGKLLKDASLVVDTFDNSKSRKLVTDYCRSHSVACLHAGVNDEYGEVVWNDNYLVPSDGGIEVCDYPLARNLILLVVATAGEALVRFITTGAKESYSITIGDLTITREHDR